MSVSIIITVYYKTNIDYFIKALESIQNQSLYKKEIIVSADGNLNNQLTELLIKLSEDNKIILINSEQNKGAGFARDLGIKNAKNDVIAIMDSDDVSDKNRLVKQLSHIEKNKFDVVGSNLLEFIEHTNDLGLERKVPADHDKITKLSKWRNPMNGASLMFRKEDYISVGGYPYDAPFFEDYVLVLKFISAGFKCFSIQENLLYARTNNDWITRRSGVTYLLAELKHLGWMYKKRYINYFEYFINILIKSILRLVPSVFLKVVYFHLLRSKNKK